MKKTGVQILLALVLLWSTAFLASLLTKEPAAKMNYTKQTEPAQTTATVAYTINVLVGGVEVSMPLTDYLTGVLLCEMPRNFHIEAQKAQAVAARTFALNSHRHGICAVCDDPGCCQGYLTEQEYYFNGGSEEGLQLARQAVEETAETVLTYNGALIEATYFSCSGGRTEDAVAVWGTDVPYLQAVDSPGEEQAEVFTESVRFSASEFQRALGVTLGGSPVNWFGSVEYTNGYGVSAMRIGGTEYSGNQLRTLLGLRSTRFSVTALSDGVIITTWGFGHRVGLSQYGAEAMARKGSGWKEILAHYYQGTRLEEYEERTD